MYKELDWARNSFKYIIEHFSLRKIHLPYYLCDVMRHTAVQAGCKPIFYHIDDNFMPDKDFLNSDYVLYPNYFGICDKNVEILSKEYPNLIVDNAHAYFSCPSGLASFTSKKKFFPDNNISELWICEYEDKRNLDLTLKEKRAYIFNMYKNKYKESNLLEIETAKSPFCYPYLAENETEADRLVKDLSKEMIIYRYWNPLPKSYNEYKFYSRLVPIPISCERF